MGMRRVFIGVAALLLTNSSFAATSNIGATPGSFNVGPSGAANYTIPLTVPPGVNGMQPGLVFSYNSQGGNGLLGMGWNLGGLSTLHRCPASYEQDGYKGGVNLDANDRFCLDGQRLLVVNGLAYGADGAEYRTEIESFTKIISYGTQGGGPAYFKAWTKTGQIIEFGATADARIEAQGKSVVLAWPVNKIQDTTGNYLTVSYTENNAAGEYYPARIDYTGNANTGLAPTRSVQFTYAARPDVETSYINGSRSQTAQRLIGVRTFVGAALVRDYRLAYDLSAATARSRLVSVQECAGDGVCLGATIPGWSTLGTPGHFTSPGWWADVHCDPAHLKQGDFNGDGKLDLICNADAGTPAWHAVALGNGDGTFTKMGAWPSATQGWCDPAHLDMGDYNGDGKLDLICNADAGWHLAALSNGDGTFTSKTAWPSATGSWCDPLHLKQGDFNGDGRTDLICNADAGWHLAALSNGDGTFTSKTAWPSATGSWCDPAHLDMGDYNGDGKTDLICNAVDGKHIVAFSTGDGQFTSPGWWPTAWCDPRHLKQGDFNGDGRTDLICNADAGWHLAALSNGDGTFTSKTAWPSATGSWCDPAHLDMGDYNGDGKTDLICNAVDGKHIVAFSTGDGQFSSPGWWPTAWCDPLHLKQGDFNGDGRTDLICNADNGKHIVAFADQTMDLMTKITTPLGIQVKDITYKPLTDASVYTKDNSAAYPVLDLQAPIYVVASYATNNGASGFNTTSLTYAGAKVHQTGRGYLGFRVVTETAPNGIKSTTTYRQDYPYIGLPTQVDVQQPNGGLLSRTLTSWNALNYGGGRYLPYAQSTTASSYELNGALITSATTVNDLLDSYGNVGRTTVTHSDNHKKVVLSSYDNDTVNWRLGRPVSTQVTSTLPNGQSQTRTSNFSYHATTGLPIKDIIEPGTALALTTDTAYDAYGHKASVTVSGPGIVTRTSTFAYLTSPGEAFAQTRSTNALGHNETQVLDARFGVPVSLIGPNGLTTTWAYDGFGRKLQETRADGTSSSWSYSACGSGCYKITATATGSPTSSVYYNSLGREWLRETQGFDGQYVYVGTQYDAFGRVATTSRPSTIPYQYKTTYSYDLLGRITLEIKPTNLATQYTYQGLSTTVKVSGVLPGGSQSTTQIKNSQGQLVQAIDAAGNSTTYSYDPFGNLVKVVDAKSNILTMGYDLRGRKTSMVDPDMGSWIYQYNALGELTYQLDAKNQAVTMQYDVLGRLIKRTEPEGISQWSYDTVANGKGKPATVTGPGGYARSYVYDSLGRPVRVSTTINATTYLMDTGYDAAGRVVSTAYPTANGQRFTVYTQYNANGYLTAVTNSAGFVYWQANARDAEGHLLQETLGNGLVTTRSYNIASGAVQSIRTGASNNVQNLNYAFDYLGNLQSRNDAIQNITETFGYDVLNRLTSVSGPAPKTYAYDSIGNITSKSDVGTYSYGAKPHAVTATTGAINATYVYDANGNMTSGNGRTLAYTSFNLPSSITKGTATTTFTYDADHARTVQTAPGETTVYLNPRWDMGGHYEKETKSSGAVEHKHYIYGSSGPVAIYTLKGDGTSTTRYLHKDHLGSVDTITSETGAVLERFSYDAFGKRRLPNGTDGAVTPATTHHGYTGHEHLDGLGLIHMNGRVYDPALGRFTQADPYIQEPTNSQSLNRYTYVVNNPFKYTDPSGYKFFLSNLTFNNIKKFAAQETTNVVKQLSNIPYVGGLATIGLFGYSPVFSAAYGWSNNDWSTVAKAHAAGAVIALTYWAGGAAASGYTNAITATGAGPGTYVFAGATYIAQSAAIGYASGFAMASIYGASHAEARQAGNMGAINGIKSAFMHMGFEYMKAATNASSAASGNTLTDPESGDLFTYGGRPPIKSDGSPGRDRSLLAFLNMTQEAEGKLNDWWANTSIRQFFNNVSKTHDWGNSWSYAQNGAWISRGVAYDTVFNAWSISTMLPSAAYTVMEQSNGVWSLNQYIGDR